MRIVDRFPHEVVEERLWIPMPDLLAELAVRDRAPRAADLVAHRGPRAVGTSDVADHDRQVVLAHALTPVTRRQTFCRAMALVLRHPGASWGLHRLAGTFPSLASSMIERLQRPALPCSTD